MSNSFAAWSRGCGVWLAVFEKLMLAFWNLQPTSAATMVCESSSPTKAPLPAGRRLRLWLGLVSPG